MLKIGALALNMLWELQTLQDQGMGKYQACNLCSSAWSPILATAPNGPECGLRQFACKI